MATVIRNQNPSAVGLGRTRFARDEDDGFHADTPDSPDMPRRQYDRLERHNSKSPRTPNVLGLPLTITRRTHPVPSAPPDADYDSPGGRGPPIRTSARPPAPALRPPTPPVRSAPRNDRDRDRGGDGDHERRDPSRTRLFDPTVSPVDAEAGGARRRVFVRAAAPDPLGLDEPLAQIAKGTSQSVHPGSSSGCVVGGVHPFEHKAFERVLAMAGCLEMLDISRKKINSRFLHALTKHDFEPNLQEFVAMHGLKPLGTHMVRFVGDQPPVHSPFVHLYVNRLPGSNETVKVWVDTKTTATTSKDTSSKELVKFAKSTTWTHLETTVEGASHWSCKARGFWPLRVVFEGPKAADPGVPHGADAQQPTVVGALKQLGDAVAASTVGTQVSGAMSSIKQWAANRSGSQAGSDREPDRQDETEEDAIARRERKERRRARREAKARVEREEHARKDPTWHEPQRERRHRHRAGEREGQREMRQGTGWEDRFIRQAASDWQREKDDYHLEQLARGEIPFDEDRRRRKVHAVI